MAESVLSHINRELSDCVAGLNQSINSQEDSHAPCTSVAASSGVVSDLATIVEAVTLGDTSEDEAFASSPPQQLSDSIPNISQIVIPPQAASSLSVSKPVSH